MKCFPGTILYIAVRGKLCVPLFMCLSIGFLTIISLRGLAKSPEGTRDHRRGRKPPVIVQQQRKSRRDDRDISNLILTSYVFCRPFWA